MTTRFSRVLAATTLLAACGDNLWPQGGALPSADQLIIVAHPDDDLMFMQPDLTLALARGESVTTVYVTAGDAGNGLDYVRRRQHAVRYAYGDAIAAGAWQCELVPIADHTPERCRSVGGHAQVTLVFLGWPDGGPEGTYPNSLRHLWEGRINRAQSVAAAPETYTQDSLLDALTAIVADTQPRRIATLDALPSHGDDHSDHTLVGAAAVIATARAHSAAPIIAYRGYNIANEPVSKGPALYEASSRMMRAYQACTSSCGECDVAPCDALDSYHEGLTLRRYATSLRQRAVTARLATVGGCLDRSGDTLLLTDCSAAGVWSLIGSELRASIDSAECVTVDSTDDGRLVLAPCDQRPGQWWRLSDDGFLISGSVTPPNDDMRTRHTRCLTADQGMVRATACGDVFGSKWQLLRTWREVGSATGHPTTLADVDGDSRADLCRTSDAGIACRKGRGDASFGPDEVWVVANTQLAHTLVIGTLGDSRAACWLTPTQLHCRGVDATGWQSDVIASSLALLDADSDGLGDICVDTITKHRCYDATGALLLVEPCVLTPGTTVNLDHRGGPDMCGAWNGQFACILRGEAPWLSTPTPWSYVDQKRVTWPASLPGPRWADIDGDGWLDAVTGDGPNLVMAYNNFYGLGPSFTTSTPVSAITSLTLGDMNGDGGAEACVQGEAAMYCQVP